MAAVPRTTLDFFAAQAAAKRRTAVLVVWFVLAWAGTIALVWVGLAFLLGTGALGVDGRHVATTPGLLAAVAAGVTLVTAGGSAFHAVRLARGGPASVAAMVGGVPVDRATTDPAERRLVNVVEEMAIASGLPVPAIYVLPREPSINAFAAGFTPDRAVVAVTRGAIDALTRDELQGVVGHELSHLLNADARLNLRLVALIGGITVLALVGRTLVRGLSDAERDLGVPRRLRGGGGRARFAVVATGLCVWAAGAVGAFFGRVIRAAVSRQREFLADAAAVQFTRNPDGLAGALAKIAERGSVVGAAGAPEVSHLFFANGLASSWLATHPPIHERIRRIAPHLVGRAARAAVAEAVAAARAAAELGVTPAQPAALAGPASAHALTASVARPDAGHLAYATGVLARLPPEVAVAARHAPGARAVVAALLADGEPTSREAQLARLADPALRPEVARLAAALEGAPREDRMAILELALPALDGLARAEAAALVADLAALAGADGRTTVFEWAVSRIVHRRLSRALGEPRRGPPRARRVEDVEVEALEVLSVLAWLGARDAASAQAALDAGAAELGVASRWRPLPRDRVRAARLDAALGRLDGAAPALKARLLAACAATALADGLVTPAEGEVVRAVAASLGVPVPPLAPAQGGRAAGAA